MIDRLRGMLSGDGLKAKTLRGSAWTVMGYGGTNLIRLISNLILTRILAPEAFGLMSLAFSLLAVLEMMADFGGGASIIRSPRGKEPVFLQTAWTMAVLRGGLITAFAWLLAWPVSRLYDEPLLFPILCTVALTSVIRGLQSVSVSTVNRDLALKRLTVLQVANGLFGTTVMVVLAWIYESVWALALGTVIGVITFTIATHLFLPRHHHALRIERAAFREIIGFGSWILVATFLTFLSSRGTHAINGLLVPLDVLGFLSIAGTLATIPAMLIRSLSGQVIFPALSQSSRDKPAEARRTIGRIRRPLLLAGIPFLFLLSALGQPIIDVLYDPRYAPAGGYLSLLALNAAIEISGVGYQSQLLAVGNSRMHAFIMFIKAALTIAGIFIGFWLAGVYGMIAGMAAGQVFTTALVLYVGQRKGYAHLSFDIPVLLAVMAVYAFQLSRLTG